jgi:hypothetical protein
MKILPMHYRSSEILWCNHFHIQTSSSCVLTSFQCNIFFLKEHNSNDYHSLYTSFYATKFQDLNSFSSMPSNLTTSHSSKAFLQNPLAFMKANNAFFIFMNEAQHALVYGKTTKDVAGP